MTDPIADMLSRIKNALNARQEAVDVPYSKLKETLLKIMIAEGYLARYEVMKRMSKQYLRVALKYTEDKKSVISGLKRVSTPGKRSYTGADALPRIRAGFGTAILSTSKGLKTDSQARQEKIGGEVLCYIW